MIRAELKKDSKEKMHKNYGIILGTLVISMLVVFLATSVGAILGPLSGLVTFIFTACAQLAIANVTLKVVKNGKAEFNDIIEPLKENLLEKMLTILLGNVYIVLWALLFWIPGIIKSLSYSQLLFILVDEDEHVYYNDAITKSRQMMDGHKWELFVLHLSFLGWIILTSLTFGVLGIYTIPYMQVTFANYYLSLKGNNVAQKVENAEEAVEAIKIN